MSNPTSRRIPVRGAVLVVLALTGIPLYLEFFGRTTGQRSGHSSQNFEISFHAAYSPILRREVTSIILISREEPIKVDYGRYVELRNGEFLSGTRRIYLIDSTGKSIETKAPIFDILWEHRQDFSDHVQNQIGFHLIPFQEFVRTLRPESWDEPLREFMKLTPEEDARLKRYEDWKKAAEKLK